MEGGPFLSDEFVEWSKNYVLFLHVTTHLENRKDEELFFDLDNREFPTLLMLSDTGEVLARRTRGLTVAGFRTLGKKMNRYRTLKKEVESGNNAASIDLELLRCDLGQLDFYDLEELLDGKELTDAQKRAFGVLKADTVVAEQQAIMRKSRFDGLSIEQAAEEFVALYAEGSIPTGPAARTFWVVLAAHARIAKDEKLTEAAAPHVKEAGRMVDRLAERLAKQKDE